VCIAENLERKDREYSVVESKSRKRGNGFPGEIKKPKDEWDCWRYRSIPIGEIRRKRCSVVLL